MSVPGSSQPCHIKPLPSRSRCGNTDASRALLIQPFALHRDAETFLLRPPGLSGSSGKPTVASARRAWDTPGLCSAEAHSSGSQAPSRASRWPLESARQPAGSAHRVGESERATRGFAQAGPQNYRGRPGQGPDRYPDRQWGREGRRGSRHAGEEGVGLLPAGSGGRGRGGDGGSSCKGAGAGGRGRGS